MALKDTCPSNQVFTITSALRSAARVTVLTGAGISAESGIPTFRDKQTGLWERCDALELATPEAFERDPALVWGCTSGAERPSCARSPIPATEPS